MHVIDAFAHASLPRFISAEEFLRVMDQNRIDAAVVATADTCPDLDELSRATANWPDRFRSIGLAIGNDAEEIRNVVTAQLEAGFLGIRLSARRILSNPDLLDLIGQAGAIPYVFGPDLFGEAALHICEFLDRYPAAVACAPHFAGIAGLDIFDTLPHARRLLHHPRFFVIFCRQGAYSLKDIGKVSSFLVHEVGWDRLMWGSEYPVCLWRDELYQETIDWIARVGIKPTEAQRKAFYFGNARKHLFDRKLRPPVELGPSWDLQRLRQKGPVWLFPRTTIELPEEIHRTLLLAYLSRGGDQSLRYSEFIGMLLTDAARRLEG